MTAIVQPIDANTNTFADWYSKTNNLIDMMASIVVTVNSNAAVGDATVIGSVTSNTGFFSSLYGGVNGTPGPITVGSNVVFSSNVQFSGANNSFGVPGNIHVTGANTTHKMLMANTSTGKLLWTSLLNELILVDGAGSGVDADLLDGQQGTYYTDIVARLGYTPANKAGDTFTGNVSFTGATVTISSNVALNGSNVAVGPANTVFITGANTTHKMLMANTSTNKLLWTSLLDEIKLVDGAGSAIDADLLDGQQGTFYTNIPARLGYTPANKAGDTFTGSVTFSSGLVVANGANTVGLSVVSNDFLFVDCSTIKVGNVVTISGTTAISSTSPTLIHQFNTGTYRTGKYLFSLKNNNSNLYTSSELLVTHNGTDAFLTEYAIIHTGTPFGTFSANVSGSVARVYFTSLSNNVTARFESTLLPT